MTKRSPSGSNTPDIIDVELFPVNQGAAPLAPLPQSTYGTPRNRARSNIQDGGYFDASHKRRPIFMISPADDQLAAVMILRAWLSAFKNHPIMTPMVTGACVWLGLFSLSAGLNFARGDVQVCEGDFWNPLISGCNLTALLAVPVQGAAGAGHDAMLGNGESRTPIETRTKIRAVRTDEE